jgi:restriction system protein
LGDQLTQISKDKRAIILVAANKRSHNDVVELLADKLALSAEERAQLLPSGKQTRFANRVNWAKAYLAKAGLVENTRRGYFRITGRGQAALADAAATINNAYLDQFKEFEDFRARINQGDGGRDAPTAQAAAPLGDETPDEALRRAHGAITGALAADLLDRVRKAKPGFFEKLIVELLLAMGYGGTSEEAGRALGQSGDDGVDGVIDQDPLGVDQIFVLVTPRTAGSGHADRASSSHGAHQSGGRAGSSASPDR